MSWKKYVSWAGVIAMVLAFVFLLFSSFQSNSTTEAETSIDKDSPKQTQNQATGNADVNNQIENNIDAEQAEVDNSVENNINQVETANVDNHVTNNIDVSIDVHLSNDVNNNIDSANKEQHKEKDNKEEDEKNKDDKKEEDEKKNGDNGKKEDDTTKENVWGVDSVNVTDEKMLSCVNEHFGVPKVWGRYLVDKDGVSNGLTKDEVALLHDHDVNILVIWNHFKDATGYDNGYAEASSAVKEAQNLDISKGTALFANVEPIYPIDTEFIKGWYDAIEESDYEAGIYGVFNPDEDLYAAFEAAAKENKALLDNMYVWTASPNIGITTESNAPEYAPNSPEGSTVIGWQYGLDAETCNIDTNWFDGKHVDVLW